MVEQNINQTKLCVLPFIHLATHPNGVVTPCCQSDMTNGFSFSKDENLNILGQNSLEQISNSNNFCGIRKQMLNGEEPKECSGCYKLEETGGVSKRNYENEKYKLTVSDLTDLTDADGKLKKINYKFIELRLGNVCNLKCLTCNPMSSTKWNEDVEHLPEKFQSGYYTIDKSFSSWYKDKEWYDELLKNSDDLQEIYINGGEPMIIKEHIYFLEKLCEMGKSNNIRLLYSINLTLISDKIIELWGKFKSVELNVSIDDIGTRNDYIRYPSKFDVIEGNLNKLVGRGMDIKIIQTISVLNVYNVVNFHEYYSDKGFKIEHNYVNWPEYLHVSLLPKNLIDKIEIDRLPEDKSKRLSNELSKNYQVFETDFVEYIKSIDSIRNLKIDKFLNEFDYLNLL
jgi:MoaA/NifB/PqqE/SkfB family radical SAM enzyme